MRLFSSVGPNPLVVRMFIAEKGLTVPVETVDIIKGENRQPAYLGRNPAGGLPCLALGDGSYLSEITAICEYLEERHPAPPLIGTTPEERATTRMWTRRVDLLICEPMINAFRFGEGLAIFKDRIPTIPEAAPGLKRAAQQRLSWLDGLMGGKSFLCGNRFTLADIMLYSFLSTFEPMGQPLNRDNRNVAGWFDRIAGRASAKA
ncbi:MAG: glutathione S-transferase family protein [Gammaproteobacteria bacterium]|nr:glutathione S-transferase family protein [Gammaproteobacteria bacterium]